MSTVFDRTASVQSLPVQARPRAATGRGARQAVVAAVAVALLVAGCAGMDDTQRRTAAGAGIGAAVGAALGGNAAGGKGVRNGALIGGAIAGIGTYIWSRQMEEQKRAMEEATAGTGVQVTQTRENLLQLDIPSDISFRVNSAAILPNFQPILDRFAQTLVANPATTVQIIGHTDSTGTDAINNPLSVNRAASARDYLVARGVQVSRIMIDGRGSRDPIADNSTPAGRAQNRRVEIYVGQAASPQQQQQGNGQYQNNGNGQYNQNGGQYNNGYQHGQRSTLQQGGQRNSYRSGSGQWSQDGTYNGNDGYSSTIQ
ncbi:MAG: OmpA family protein [Lautropia mirabilis]|nr:OmpA family protein [Lautropia mirabilis]